MSASKSRVIVLTGATRGLGRAMAAGFARLGHTVLGCGRSADGIAALQRAHPSPHSFAVVDVTSDAAVAAWARDLTGRYGAPDLLVNNAATINRSAPLWEIGAEEFQSVLATNITGVANTIRHFLPSMVARGTGVVVNFSSGWGRSVDAEVAPYCATKWAIEGLSRALARELPAGMAAVPLNPGIIDTEMLRSCFGPAAREYPSPEDWAKRAVPYLLGLGPGDNGRPASIND